MRNLDVLFGEYLPPPLIDVPVCRDAFRRRRRAAILAVVITIAFILVGGFFATMLVIDGKRIPAAVLGAAILLVALAGRTGWDDALLDRRIVGVSARRAFGGRLLLRFRRDPYYSQWSALNPSASSGGGATGWRQPRGTAAPEPSIAFDRKVPAIAFVVLALVVALHHWNAATGGEVFYVGSSLAMMFTFLAAGGIVYPPIFWSISTHGKALPGWVKAVGVLLAIAGLTAGFLLAISYRHR